VLIGAPTITSTVVQNFFIEALGGSQNPISYLDRFPDTVYSKAYDSLLVQFMYALLGPVGVGSLRQDYLEARLQFEMANIQITDLDSLYSNAFGFARLAEETYELDASASLLPAAQRAQVLAQDASFRNRAQDFLRGARAGDTLLGITLAAKSGLGTPVEAIENYRSLFDHYTDIPMGLPTFGQTTRVNEVIIIPRALAPKNDVQTIAITGEPLSGWFTLTYPAGQNWLVVPVICTGHNATITVPTVFNFPVGTFVTVTNILTSTVNPVLDPTTLWWNNVQLYAQVGSVSGGTTVNLVQTLMGGINAGTPALVPDSGTFYAFVGVAQTVPLPYNATSGQIQVALTSLPVVGSGNIICGDGPLPSHPITITFVGMLSDVSTPTIAVNAATDLATGVGVGANGLLADVEENPLTVNADVTTTTIGVSGPGLDTTTISPANEYSMRLAIDQIKSLPTFISTTSGSRDTFQQLVNTTFSAAYQTEVIRYVTGRNDISWPNLDTTHWIQAGQEHEGPLPYGASGRQYTGFHNISNIVAYTDQALLDTNYGAGTLGVGTYWDTLIGSFSQAQLALMPGLSALQNTRMQFTSTGAAATQTEPLVISTVAGKGIVDGTYPVDYLSLPGITKTFTQGGGTLWASMERTAGSDYLEIDLGQAQPVNYLYFQATAKPYAIAVYYDTFDQSPQRSFVPALIPPMSGSTTNLTFNALKIWTTCEIFFTNLQGGMIYTRFLRLEFTKQPANTLYAPIGRATVPYSIEVQHLRVGRNISA
jgi:hypothetical protein